MRPDQRDFTNRLQTVEQLVGLVHSDCQNQKTSEYLKEIERCKNNDTLRMTSLGVATIMWIDDHASHLSTYDAVCEYLQPEYATFYTRILDVGFWNRWWNLERHMDEYDVNF